jgi:ubiquinone/menaquinone biosynthesis C-methylase UbiE
MQIERLGDYACPVHGAPLELGDHVLTGHDVTTGSLVCAKGDSYPIVDGLPTFVSATDLSDVELNTQAEYDRVAEEIYDVALDWQFAAMYEDEDRVRESMIDMMHLGPGARVLEIGCGTGRDSFRLARRVGDEGFLHLQDLSGGMVRVCRERMREWARTQPSVCPMDYSVSSATALPFPDESFDAVYHFGGFNQFGDLRRGAAELTRVAKRGGRVLIGDEAVAPWLKGTEFEGIVTTNNPLFKFDAPLHVLPHGARDVTVRWIMANCFYVVAFTKEAGPPALDLDLPHRGWRGGTMRSRYFGVLEGVTPEAKELARKAAAASGLSVHEWLDAAVRETASATLRDTK